MPASHLIDRISKPRTLEELQICGKPVCIFEDHATAFIAWAKIKNQLGAPPFLVSLDKHLDTRPAFNRLIAAETNSSPSAYWAASKRNVDSIDLSSVETAKETLRYLQNDEHINAAIQAEVIEFAFAISPAADHLEGRCSPECANIIEMQLPSPDEPLEDASLLAAWERISEFAERANRRRFVLDLDLDLFRSEEATSPRSGSVFHDIVREACAITIAEEPSFAAPGADVQRIKTNILQQITLALS